MAKQLMLVRLKPNEVTPGAVQRILQLAESDLDLTFGVVPIDPVAHQYAIRVEPSAAARLSKLDIVSGPYANPNIEPT